MKPHLYSSYFFLVCSLLFSLNSFGEGTKELMPSATNSTQILIANGNVGGQARDPFALEGGDPDYRLCIHISDSLHETIYFGLGATGGGGSVNWRIYAPDGTLAWPVTPTLTPINDEPGYIATYDQAINGPQVISSEGYDPISLVPKFNGDYYMTFEVANGSSRNFDFFDITVVNNASGSDVAVPGRVFSKCWQIHNPQNGANYYTFQAQMFIYSNDGIVTRLNSNNFEGRDFSFSSNESGCYKVDATHNVQKARQSQTTRHNYPQYKIFLNNPDTLAYPDGVIGHLVPNSTTTQSNCDGTIIFNFETAPVHALGTAEITLELSQIVPQPATPYIDRILQDNLLTGGVHQDIWDGKDGNGVQIPSGATFPFTLRYTNGLTHLPLWDVENNIHGFLINLVRPVQDPPLGNPAFYWDDQLISGTTGTINVNPPGCIDAVNGCHGWGNNSWPSPYSANLWGDMRTINTWWYLVSNSSDTVTIVYKKRPSTLSIVPPLPTDVCQGGTVTLTVSDDPSSTSYRWVWDYGSDTTHAPIITITLPGNATPGTSHIFVNGMNNECPDGPVLDIPITIRAIPNAAISGAGQVCAGSSQTYSTIAGMNNYTWSVTGGSIDLGQGTSQITITWNTVGTGTATVTFVDAFGCGTINPGTKNITVNPLPAASISGNAAVCLNATSPTITFTGTTGTPPYTFSYTINGGPAQQTISAGNSTTLSVPTTTTGTYVYSLVGVEDANSCSQAQSSSVTVTVYPLPTASVTGNISICQNASSPAIIFTGNSGTTPYTFTYNINGGSNSSISTIVGNTVSIPVLTGSTGTFVYNLISVSDAHGCTQPQSGQATVTVTSLPTATISGNISVCQNDASPAVVFTGASSLSPYLFSYNINGGAVQTVTSVGNTATVAAPTNISGSFTYNLVSVQDLTTTCSQPQTGNITVVVKPLPTAVISGSTSVCQFGTSPQIMFTGSAATAPYTFTYNINGGAPQVVTSVGNTATVSVPTTTTGTYNYNLVSVSDGSVSPSCSQLQAGTASVIVKPLPVPSIGGPPSVCINTAGPVYTTEAGMLGYSWSITGGSITSGSTTNSVSVTWNTLGMQSISVNYTDPVTSCTAQAATSYTVQVNTLPNPAIAGATAICTGIPTTYSTQAGMQNYAWNISPGGVINSGSGTNTINVTWNTPGANTISVNYSLGSGCAALNPTVVNVTVNQSTPPTLTSSLNPVCESYSAVYTSQPGMTAYSWTISAGGTPVSGGGTSDNTFTVKWNTPGANTVSVNFTNQFGCIAPSPFTFNVTVNPLPNATVTGPAAVCQDYPAAYQYQTSVVETATYSWSITGATGTMTPTAGSNPVNINWTIPGSATLTINAMSSLGCPNSGSLPVTVHPKPAVSMISCFDAVTTKSGKRFQMKGGNPPYLLAGSPLQGIYISNPPTPALQTDASGYYYFNPSLATTGTYQISYKYTNQFGCPNTTGNSAIITVQGPNPACNSTMTDPRDGKIYKTAMISGRCWMTENLNYSKSGTATPLGTAMTDNCVAEKYCPPADPTCTVSGGFYQWDELTQYGNTDAPYQGVCPAGWHVPTEAEWQTLVNMLDPSFTVPSTNALAGSEMKDPGKSFKALFGGINYLENTWYLTSGLTGTMFWTSTNIGLNRALARGLNDPNPSISRYPSSHANAFPVRCVKD
jgi:uncharacterized protein (TIGR02145 family)